MILTVTYNPAVDQTLHFDGELAPGTVSRAADARYDPGGKGINVSQYLDALNTETVATGLLGGFTGRFVADALARDGIEADFVDVEERTRLNTTALAADGEYKLNQDGPRVPASAVDDLLAILDEHDPERVHVAGSLPPGLGVDAIDAVATAGAWETSVDVYGDLLAAVDGEHELCTPNRSELGEATGRDVSTLDGCVTAAERLRDRGFERVLASLGAEGAFYSGPDGVLVADALDADVVDTVGAGDSLAAGYLAAIDAGESTESALRNGIAVASAVVERSGTSVPTFERVATRRKALELRRY
ncbi:fructose-1-phosphate kinase [Halomicrobium zhouii]|uniref:Fructose-1-phosphate kinase n=1 Tax=Halomicrobium zhouii TaxID=767519 RepID=A0A1I6LRD8_9EURY|nr:1-phosphofructokinase [Halomicrobium zhouii]SFS05993.1 fructose-1-phosphate kinase [Halomicrobium zhouii]